MPTFAERLRTGEHCACLWDPEQSKLEPPKVTECAYHGGLRQQLARLVAEKTHEASKY